MGYSNRVYCVHTDDLDILTVEALHEYDENYVSADLANEFPNTIYFIVEPRVWDITITVNAEGLDAAHDLAQDMIHSTLSPQHYVDVDVKPNNRKRGA